MPRAVLPDAVNGDPLNLSGSRPGILAVAATRVAISPASTTVTVGDSLDLPLADEEYNASARVAVKRNPVTYGRMRPLWASGFFLFISVIMLLRCRKLKAFRLR
jgi:hypothetical protein